MPQKQTERQLVWPHDGQVAEAKGTLECCLLALMVICQTRFAWGAVVLLGVASGLVSLDSLEPLLASFVT
jgi:hypothetical protein